MEQTQEKKDIDLVFNLRHEKLAEEDIKELLKRAWEEDNREAWILLRVKEWDEISEKFIHRNETKILYGEAEKVLINEEYNYEERRLEKEYLIIPKSKLVIVLEREYLDTPTLEDREGLTVYVFTGEGWYTHVISRVKYF